MKKQGFLMPPYSLNNFEIQKYYNNEPRFSGVYSRDNLPDKIYDGSYMINFGCSDIGFLCMRWIIMLFVLLVLVQNTFQKKLNTFTIQAYDSVMCGYYYSDTYSKHRFTSRHRFGKNWFRLSNQWFSQTIIKVSQGAANNQIIDKKTSLKKFVILWIICGVSPT